MFLVYINVIWRNIDMSIGLFTDERNIYWKFTDKNNIENLQKFLNTLWNGRWKMGLK